MNGRMYDALLGRMLSPDRYVQDATSTQAYNRYSYVMNNPLKYTDPSGWIAYNKQREHAIEPDPNNYRSGTGGSVGNWGFYANGGASGYNYSGPYSLYASNPAQYASTYGSQTWMQQATTAAYEAQKNGIKYTVEIYDWYKKYSDGTMEYMDTQYKFEKQGKVYS
jgi:pyocin large subunit-like protein